VTLSPLRLGGRICTCIKTELQGVSPRGLPGGFHLLSANGSHVTLCRKKLLETPLSSITHKSLSVETSSVRVLVCCHCGAPGYSCRDFLPNVEKEGVKSAAGERVVTGAREGRTNQGKTRALEMQEGKASRGLGVEKHTEEEPSGRRFLEWVVRHPDWPWGRGV
jgi:hypothetical protein